MDPPQPVPGVGDGMFLDELPAEAVDAIVETRAGRPPLLSLEVRHLGGALARPSHEHGAVGSIDAALRGVRGRLRPDAGDRAGGRAGRRPCRRALAPAGGPSRTYFNFSERPVAPERLYPTETYRRLRRVKTEYDAGGLFVANHPIPPAR